MFENCFHTLKSSKFGDFIGFYDFLLFAGELQSDQHVFSTLIEIYGILSFGKAFLIDFLFHIKNLFKDFVALG